MSAGQGHSAAKLATRPAEAFAERDAVALARPGLHDTVMEILSALPRGRLLDVPAGEGALAVRLIQMGFEVRCCDLHPEIFRVKEVEIQRGDLCGVLPYADAEFDYITCLEGLEHIENPQQAVRELHRLLRSGGHLIVSVPNILNVEERVKWLLHGYTSHFKPLSRELVQETRQQYGELEEVALHVHPIAYSELRYILEKYGFELRRAFRDAPKPKLWLYWPLVAAIRLIAWFTPARKRRERWTEELQCDPILQGGNTLILHAVKR